MGLKVKKESKKNYKNSVKGMREVKELNMKVKDLTNDSWIRGDF